MGSTSPAMVFLLGGVAGVFQTGDIPVVALFVNAICQAGIVLVAYLLLHGWLRRRLPSVLGAVLVGFSSINIYIFSCGFENALLTLVLLMSVFASSKKKTKSAMFLASLAPLIRPEGILVSPVIWYRSLRNGQFRKSWLMIWLAFPLIWVGFSFVYYGSPVPHSITAKRHFPAIYKPYVDKTITLTRGFGKLGDSVVKQWSGTLYPVLLSGRTGAGKPGKLRMIRLAAFWLGAASVLFILGYLIHTRQWDSEFADMALYPVFFSLFYALAGTMLIWYLPSFTTFAMLAMYGSTVMALQMMLRAKNGIRLHVFRVLIIVSGLGWALTNSYEISNEKEDEAKLAYIHPADPRSGSWRRWEKDRFENYRDAARYLNRIAGPGDVVAISEVGVFGYYYRGPVFDTVGICSPEAISFYPPPAEDVFTDDGKYYTYSNNIVPSKLLKTIRPRYVVNSLVYMKHMTRPGTWFVKNYEYIKTFGNVWYQPMNVYKLSSGRDSKHEENAGM